ncbi:MAG: hypothetical protein AABZ44_09785, partial [Elusimicrobiota bacterium]
ELLLSGRTAAIGPDGKRYFADHTNSRIVISQLDKNSQWRQTGVIKGGAAGDGWLARPASLIFSPDAKMYVDNAFRSDILIYAQDAKGNWHYDDRIPPLYNFGGRILKFGPDGDLYVGGGAYVKRLKRDARGKWKEAESLFTTDATRMPDFTFSPQGDLYVIGDAVIDHELQGALFIYRRNARGGWRPLRKISLLKLFAHLSEEVYVQNLNSLGFTPEGLFYIAGSNNRIYFFANAASLALAKLGNLPQTEQPALLEEVDVMLRNEPDIGLSFMLTPSIQDSMAAWRTLAPSLAKLDVKRKKIIAGVDFKNKTAHSFLNRLSVNELRLLAALEDLHYGAKGVLLGHIERLLAIKNVRKDRGSLRGVLRALWGAFVLTRRGALQADALAALLASLQKDNIGAAKDLFNSMAYGDTRLVEDFNFERRLGTYLKKDQAPDMAALYAQWLDFLSATLFKRLDLNPAQARALKTDFKERANVWNISGFLQDLSIHSAFLVASGTKIARTLLIELAGSPTDPDDSRFVYSQRYDAVKTAFAKFQGVAERWTQEYRQESKMSAHRTVDPLANARVQPATWGLHLAQIKEHLGNEWESGRTREKIATLKAKLAAGGELSDRSDAAIYANYLEQMLPAFEQVLGNLKHNKAPPQEALQVLFLLLAKQDLIKDILPDLANTLTDLRNLHKEMRAISNPDSRLTTHDSRLALEVTDDPVAMLVMGEEPFVTCQRCLESSGQTSRGELLNRLRLGQIKLANIYQGETLVARTVLELGWASANEAEDRVPALFAERLYVAQGETIDLAALKDLITDYARHLDVSFVFWGETDKHDSWQARETGLQQIAYQLLPAKGALYRDSFSGDNGKNRALASALKSSAIQQRGFAGAGILAALAALPVLPTLIHSVFQPSTLNLQPSLLLTLAALPLIGVALGPSRYSKKSEILDKLSKFNHVSLNDHSQYEVLSDISKELSAQPEAFRDLVNLALDRKDFTYDTNQWMGIVSGIDPIARDLAKTLNLLRLIEQARANNPALASAAAKSPLILAKLLKNLNIIYAAHAKLPLNITEKNFHIAAFRDDYQSWVRQISRSLTHIVNHAPQTLTKPLIKDLQNELLELATRPGGKLSPNAMLESQVALNKLDALYAAAPDTLKIDASQTDSWDDLVDSYGVEPAEKPSEPSGDAQSAPSPEPLQAAQDFSDIEKAKQIIINSEKYLNDEPRFKAPGPDAQTPYRTSAYQQALSPRDILNQALLTVERFLQTPQPAKQVSALVQNNAFRSSLYWLTMQEYPHPGALAGTPRYPHAATAMALVNKYWPEKYWESSDPLDYLRLAIIGSGILSVLPFLIFTLVQSWLRYGVGIPLTVIALLPTLLTIKSAIKYRNAPILKALREEKSAARIRVKAAKLRVDPSVTPNVLPVILSEAKDQSSDSFIDSS